MTAPQRHVCGERGRCPDQVSEQKRGLESCLDAAPCNFSSEPFLFVFASCML